MNSNFLFRDFGLCPRDIFLLVDLATTPAWRQLWIKFIAKIPSDISSILTEVAQVRCSGNDFSGDPDNICGDKNPPPACLTLSGGAPLGGPVQLEEQSQKGKISLLLPGIIVGPGFSFTKHSPRLFHECPR